MKILYILVPLVLIAQNSNYFANNDAITGTVLYKTAKINSSGNALTPSPGDIVQGIVSGGAGLAGKSTICISGNCICTFDNSPVIGDYVVLGTAGACHSNGSSLPSSGQVIGKVNIGASPTNTALVDMTLKQTSLTSATGTGSVNYGVDSVPCTAAPNFNLNSSLYSVQQITLTCAVSSMSISNLSPGALVTFRVCRDGVNRSWITWPGNFRGAFNNTSPRPSSCDSQSFYSPDGTILQANSLGTLNQ
jgi:hypothetical protein